MRAADPDEYLDMDDSDVDDFEAVPDRNAAVLTCAGVHLEDNSMSSSAERAYEIPPLPRIPTQPDIEMGTVSLPVPGDAMEVDFDAGVEPALVRRGAKRISALWEERADQTDMEVCPDTAGECCDRDAVETLSWYATVGGIRTEQECQMFWRRHEYEKSSMQTVISTTASHKAKRDDAQLRVVTHEYADAMLVQLRVAEVEQLYQVKRMIGGIVNKTREDEREKKREEERKREREKVRKREREEERKREKRRRERERTEERERERGRPSVCAFKTPACVRSKRPRVYRHHAHMLKKTKQKKEKKKRRIKREKKVKSPWYTCHFHMWR